MKLRLLVLSSPDPAITSFDLSEGILEAGREFGRELYLPSPKVSRRHCSFEVSGGQVVVRDLGSANGVVVEGQKIREAILAIGQRIQLGDYLLQLSDGSEDQALKVQSPQAPPMEDLFGSSESAPAASNDPPPMFGGFGGGGDSSLFGEESGSEGPPPLGDLFGERPDDASPPAFGVNSQPEQVSHQTRPPPISTATGQQILETNPRVASSPVAELLASIGVDKVLKFISKLPWSGRLGGLFLVAFLASILLPIGGIKGLLSGVDTGMEGLARSYAVELTSTIARVNGEALSKLDATSIGSGSIGGADRAKGVISGEVFLLDSRGRIKPTSDRPNPRPRLVNRASETQDVAYETDSETGLFYVVAPIRISIGNAPAQVRGFVYVGFSVEDFLEDTGRANDLLPAALLSLFLIFSVLFWVVRTHANRPILAAAEESELAMKGHIKEVTLAQSWPELGALLHSVNRAIGRGGVGVGSGYDSIDSGAISESLVKSCSWPVIVTDGDLNVTMINDIARRIFGLNSAAGVGAHISRVVTKEALSKAVLGALRTMQSGELDIITQTVNVDGSQRRVTVSSKLASKSSRQKSESDRKVFEFVVVVIA